MKIKVLLGIMCLFSIHSFSQQRIILVDELQNDKIQTINRLINKYEADPEAIEMNTENSSGLGILKEIEFEKGSVEIELLGENNPGKSFIGLAFNIQNDSTYEAIYFRPFNFVAEEQLRRDHMVQYIFHPEFTWYKLRTERTGEFEDGITNPPNPDDWFTAIIKIDEKKIQVFVNEETQAALTVDRLTSTKSNKIGLWTGYGSSGRFKNIVLRKE